MLKYWLWLATRKGLGLQTIYTVARSFSDVEQAYRATPEQYKEFAGLSRSGSLSDKDLTEAERILRRCEQADIRIVTLLDAEYPKMLRTMPDAPIAVVGQLSIKASMLGVLAKSIALPSVTALLP